MQVVYSEDHRQHYPRHFLVNGAQHESPEVPERADRLLAAARAGGHGIVGRQHFGRGPVADIHTPEYLQFLEHIVTRWRRIEGASEEVIPNIHPQGRWQTGYPASAVGQAGWHQADTACPISEGTWEAALASADVAVTGAEIVRQGARVAYALCRPPGHHAYPDMAGGFCFLNNSAVAAQWLRRTHSRVAILDVDVHHGNGTQGVFYSRPDVLTDSLHADPVRFYPFFWGHANERGEGDGTGYNLNVPLPRGTDTAGYLQAMDRAFQRIRAFAPTALVVALGLDPHEDDPLKGLSITTEGFAEIAARIAGLKLPTLLVQEGGYLSDALGDNLKSFLAGFEGAVGS
jgi:acetoin utilization deacetylase AcuC-like enzyme